METEKPSCLTNFIQFKIVTAKKMKFFSKNFFSKCDQICNFPQIWLHLVKEFLMQKFILCAVCNV